MTRLSKEREGEIRIACTPGSLRNATYYYPVCNELLSEIDALRADLKGQCLGMGDDFSDSPIEVIKHLKEDRDTLKKCLFQMQEAAKDLVCQNQKLRERVAKLREALRILAFEENETN